MSAVMASCEWPRRLLTATKDSPAARPRDALVWRRSCSPMGGKPPASHAREQSGEVRRLQSTAVFHREDQAAVNPCVGAPSKLSGPLALPVGLQDIDRYGGLVFRVDVPRLGGGRSAATLLLLALAGVGGAAVDGPAGSWTGTCQIWADMCLRSARF